MVRMRREEPETWLTYVLKPGQTLENTKISDRSLALVVPESCYQRLADYSKEHERAALLAEREKKRLEELRKATVKMSRSWHDNVKIIQKRRKEEIQARKQHEEDERKRFVKETAEKKQQIRAEAVKRANEVLLARKPLCRPLVQALQTAEVLRELNAQVEFKNSMSGIGKKLEDEYARSILQDVEKFREEEKERKQKALEKIQTNKENLEKQIEVHQRKTKMLEEATRKVELEELKNMEQEILEIKQTELEEELKKKDELKKMFLEHIEEMKEFERKAREEEEFQDKSIKFYREMKEHIDKTIKLQKKKILDKKITRVQELSRKIGLALKEQEPESEEEDPSVVKQRLEEERKQWEQEKLEVEKRRREKARQYQQELLRTNRETQEKRQKEEQEMKAFEMLQRYKRDEFNKEWIRQEKESERKKQLEYGAALKKQMFARASRARIEKVNADDSFAVKEMIKDGIQSIVNYGERALQESKGVRPTYPIEKAIRNLKMETGLLPKYRKRDPNNEVSEISKCRRQRRAICLKPVDEENALYLG